MTYPPSLSLETGDAQIDGFFFFFDEIQQAPSSLRRSSRFVDSPRPRLPRQRPVIAGATLLIGLFGGIGFQSWRDAVSTVPTPASTVAQPVPLPEPQHDSASPGSSKQQRHSRAKAKPGAEDER